MSSGRRRLAAIMFTDMVGYTALGQKNESLSLALAAEQRKIIRALLARHHGREVKTMGDAFFAEFASSLDAVRCAYDIQRVTREVNVGKPEDRRVHLRLGIHLGDVVSSGGDISGDAVNIASRIESVAEDGGVCLTRHVYDQVQNKLEIQFVSLGSKPLKNVVHPQEVFKMIMPWGEKKETVPAPLDKNRVAVLPLTNMSPDPNDGYFADGMTDELISALSKLPGLGVISRTSVMRYKSQMKSVGEIGHDLGAGTILEGSVRKAGNRVRITVQLIDANTDNHLWAENYDRNLDDIFAIQSDVASHVSGSLRAGVFAGASHPDTRDIEAYTIYIRAMQLGRDSSETGLRKAIALLEDVVSRDPSFVRAYVGLAIQWLQMAREGYEDFIVVDEKAKVEAQKALKIEPSSAEAHAVLAEVYAALDLGDEAVSEAETAIRFNPNVSDAHFTLGMIHSTNGLLDKGELYMRKAAELDPLSVFKWRTLGAVLRSSGKVDESLALLTRIRQLYPDDSLLYPGLAECYMAKGDYETAQQMLDKGSSLSPEDWFLQVEQAILYAATGKPDSAKKILRKLQSNKSESVQTSSQLFIQAALGNLDEAFKALNRGVETHVWPFLIKTQPVFKELRKDPRFRDFCIKMNLPPE